MKLDRRFLKGVETLGHGQVEPARQMATDGHNTLLVVASDSGCAIDTPRKIEKTQAKTLLKDNNLEPLAEDFEIGKMLSDEMLRNMNGHFEGHPDARFVVDWDLLAKAVKALGADTKNRKQIICDLHIHQGIAYYRLMLNGSSDAVAYVAGAIEQVASVENAQPIE